ncbi:MAG: hypothetical protein LKH08_04060 [Atopobiaceae bacterium]|nr:hypothetical protein [Atopobiaceae bacterium]MCH4119158.1 hypothetical protein [Atopobiaceae bacterium]MCI1388583.1 hypothetical protein [Atopobiaceae bacterium]MCI1432082.1 hypothetical protein [Atopobiaceae bacterium]MCI1470540.1 hypothetical protein [Atopobiaceae bacterium]
MAYEDQALDITFDTEAGETSVYHVRDALGNTMRVLEVEGSLQSATFLGDRYCELVFDYTKRLDVAFEARPGATSCLVLGGGGFSYPKHLIATRPECVVDVVEADEGIVDVAYEFFYLDRLEEEYDLARTGRLRTHVAEGAAFLSSCCRTFDVIVVDLYRGPEPDESLLSPDGMSDLARAAGRRGIVAANVVSALEGPGAERLGRAMRALKGAFAHAAVARVGEGDPAEEDNLVVLASQEAISASGVMPWGE